MVPEMWFAWWMGNKASAMSWYGLIDHILAHWQQHVRRHT
jgi:hypothetical protein